MFRVKRADESRQAAQQHGLQRTLLSNMIVGVDTGFTTTLQARRAVGVLSLLTAWLLSGRCPLRPAWLGCEV